MSGSSPLTRGKLVRALVHIGYLGLIPAHAGKTRGGGLHVTRRSAHPRSRGENKERTVIKNRELGSSPLTRGKPGVAGCTSRADRLIPAHAGKTPGRRGGVPRARAHPRSRGENEVRGMTTRTRGGSSPLTRGKLSAEKPDFLTGRLIPAHAGKTPGRRGGVPRARAHPRSRGENPCIMRAFSS